VRRGANRAVYARHDILAILDAGLVAHVGVQTPDGPLVLPMAYGRDDDHIYVHGAVANHLLGSGDGTDVCVTVTLVDGLVVARGVFHNSMNYRSVVIRGRARRVEGDAERLRVLQLITDHVVDQWDTSRAPNAAELKRTLVLAIPLAEASAKVRAGDPVDDAEDLDGPWWAGTVPIATTFEAPVSAADLAGPIPTPEAITGLADRNPDSRR
jgi:nitroimidazol reductase NimA-like FMN-containing flavoprotein (pyridoxamine 5'-phosphate oxidase superfamily)